jgi:hypothetical protein
MLSRLRKSSRKRISGISFYKPIVNRSMVKVALTSKEKDRERMASPRTTSPSHNKEG